MAMPPPARDVLPGVFRPHIPETHGNSEEDVLTIDDRKFANDIYISISVVR
jgi:hypothetical protein